MDISEKRLNGKVTCTQRPRSKQYAVTLSTELDFQIIGIEKKIMK